MAIIMSGIKKKQSSWMLLILNHQLLKTVAYSDLAEVVLISTNVGISVM